MTESSNFFILFLLLVFVRGEQIRSEECVSSLDRYIVNNLKPHQVVLLTSTKSIAESTIAVILQHIPHIAMEVNEISPEDLLKSMAKPSFYNPSKTSLFLLVNSFHNGTSSSSSISSSLKYLTELSPAKARPKVLLISSTNQKSSFEAFLRNMWLKRFLNFVVLELRSTEKVPKIEKLKPVKTFVHYYNPFTNRYFRKKCSSTIDWFPKKLLDLHGHQIKGGLFFKPPFSLTTYDKFGNLESSTGADLDMFWAFSEAMNFSTLIVSDVNSTIGIFHKNEATALLGHLINNRINILITMVINFRPASEGALYGFTNSYDMDSIVALIPIKHDSNEQYCLKMYYLYSKMLFLIGFVIIMWAMIGRIKNEENSWKPEYIAAIVLGVSIQKRPNPTRHRLMFLYLIIVGYYCSSTFMGGLTASKVKHNNEKKMETFLDLANSNLTLFIEGNLERYLHDDSEELQLIRKKVISTFKMDTDCIEVLVKHKNVSCFIYRSYARQLVKIFKDTLGQPITKILNQKLFDVRKVIVLERSSPYKERLDQLLPIFTECGLRKKWENNITNDMFLLNFFGVNKHNDSMLVQISDLGLISNLVKVLCFVGLSGYLLSFLVFIAEILFYRFFNSNTETDNV